MLTACGGDEPQVDESGTFDESEYIDAPTTEEQVEQSKIDQSLYKQAKAENDKNICEEIQSRSLQKLCRGHFG